MAAVHRLASGHGKGSTKDGAAGATGPQKEQSCGWAEGSPGPSLLTILRLPCSITVHVLKMAAEPESRSQNQVQSASGPHPGDNSEIVLFFFFWCDTLKCRPLSTERSIYCYKAEQRKRKHLGMGLSGT